MDPSTKEKRIRCPWCGEGIDIVIDCSAGGQSYIEDCQVCCQPIEISYEVEDGEPQPVRVDRAG